MTNLPPIRHPKKEAPAKKSSGATARRRVLVVDDHPIFLNGICQLINDQPDLLVCGEVSSALQALTAVDELKPDLLVLDLSIHGTNGIELMKSIRAQHPKMHALMVSMHDERIYALRALRAGAMGYIMKSAPSEKVVEAIRKVLNGGLYVSETVGAGMLNSFLRGDTGDDSPVGTLSDREIEVFRAIGEGKSTREIAWALHLSAKTVETHRAHIKTKLNIQTAPELIRAAVDWVTNEANG